MNKSMVTIGLLFSLISTPFFGYLKEEGIDFKMVPGNFLQIENYTGFDQKAKEWKWQPNDHFKLARYKKRIPCGNEPDYFEQLWLFQAYKPGQTELVFTHKKKQKKFTIKILGHIHNPNQTTPQYGLFDSNQ